MQKKSFPMKKLIPSLILIFTFHAAFPCLIVVVTDGQRVLVGNHEDWFARDARARFEPATAPTRIGGERRAQPVEKDLVMIGRTG